VCVVVRQLGGELMAQPDWDSRLGRMTSTLIAAGVVPPESAPKLHHAVTSFYRKLYIADNYRPTSSLAASTRLTLVRAADSTGQVDSLGEDYGVRDVYDGLVDIHIMQGTHESFVTDADSSVQLARLFDAVLSG